VVVCLQAVDDMWNHAIAISCLQLKSKMPLVSRGWRQDVDYKLIRNIFLAEYGLPRSFDYLSYIKKILHRNVAHSIHIHVGTWMVRTLRQSLVSTRCQRAHS
jgi:hypothetical protein